MTNIIENESTKASPVSEAIARKVLDDFVDLYWPVGKERTADGEQEFILNITPTVLIKYAAWWFRGNGHPSPDHQVVKGWSKLRLRTDGYIPTDEDVEQIKDRGATA